MKKCPNCKGIGFVPAIFKDISIICDMCKGTCKVNDEVFGWIEEGLELKNYRINVLGLTLRQASILYNIPAHILSKYERGVLKPKNLYEKEHHI